MFRLFTFMSNYNIILCVCVALADVVSLEPAEQSAELMPSTSSADRDSNQSGQGLFSLYRLTRCRVTSHVKLTIPRHRQHFTIMAFWLFE